MNIWRNLTHGHEPADPEPADQAQAELGATSAASGHPADAAEAVSTSAGARRIPRGQLPAASGTAAVSSNIPELAEAQSRLDALDPELVPDNLAQAVRDAARKAYVARSIREWIRDAEEAVAAAMAAADPLGAVAASDELVAGERLVPNLPGTEIDPAVVAEALGLASAMLREAIGPLGPVPETVYSLELAAWESLPDVIRASTTPPVAMQQDLSAKAVREEAELRRETMLQAYRGWQAAAGGAVDVLNHLAAAQSLVAQLAELHEPLQAATTTVERANADRAAAGVRWEPPRDRTSPAIERLRMSMADHMAATQAS